MIQCRAIRKLKDNNGTTIGYVLQDAAGNTMNASSESIKTAIINKQAVIDNLKITSDGRLILSTNNSSTKSTSSANTSKTPKSNKHTYPKISDAKLIKTDKNKQRGYTNYSDAYDFNSTMVPFEYNLPRYEYIGYIKDKKNNVYMVSALQSSEDAGRIAGGATSYDVIINYAPSNVPNTTPSNAPLSIKLHGHSSAFSRSYGTNIIDDLIKGYYLEDYLTKNKDAISYNYKDIVAKIVEGNTYNPISEADRLKAIEEEKERQAQAEARQAMLNQMKQFENRYDLLDNRTIRIGVGGDIPVKYSCNKVDPRIDDSCIQLQLRNANKRYKFALDKIDTQLVIVDTEKAADVTGKVPVHTYRRKHVLNSTNFDASWFKSNKDWDTLDDFLYKYNSKYIPLKTFVYDILYIILDSAFPEDGGKQINNTVYSSVADGEIRYNIRSDVFYFISADRKHVVSLNINHSQNNPSTNSEDIYKINAIAKQKFGYDNFISRLSHKQYKPHANELVIWVNG